MKNEDTSSYITSDAHQTQDEVHLDIENASRTKDAVGGKFIALSSHTARDRINANSYIGNLLPLGLGHSETLRQEEIEAYEYHLRNAQMI